MGDAAKQARSPRSNFPVKPIANAKAIVGGAEGDKYRFTILTDGLLRYEWSPDGKFEDRASAFAINRDFPVPEFRVERRAVDGTEIIEIITQKFHLTYNVTDSFGPSSLSVGVKGSLWRYGQECETLGGTARTLDMADGRIPLGPGVVSKKGYSAIDDSTSMLFGSNGSIETRNLSAGRVDGYLFAYGHDYAGAVQALYELSGKQPLLPRWALGNWWSRYHAYSDKEYLALMDNFEKHSIPLSVAVIDMDWHLVKDPRVYASGTTGWTGYTWNRDLFPNPEHFLGELHRRELKVTLNDHPADGVQSYEDLYPAMAKALQHPVEHNDPIQFDITDRKFRDAFFDVLHRSLEDQGVDFWWVDWQQGEHSRIPSIDPLWVLNHFHFLDNKLHNKRPLIFSRYAGPGSHRYPVGFSGDTVISWASLAFQPEFTATASNIGYAWWSHDIGGHIYGAKDDELGLRWVQLGCFSPVLRLHSSDNEWVTKEPWTYPHDISQAMSAYLRLRHRLIPYLYTMNVWSAANGVPLVKPMYWAYPDHKEAYEVPNQYFFGSELIVLPITTPQKPRVRLAKTKGWLPPGKYVDIMTGALYNGDRELWVSRKLKDYPVFAREGSIIPLDGDYEPRNGAKNPTEIELLIVVGADGSFDLIEDDGGGSTFDETYLIRTPIDYSQIDGTVTIGRSTGHFTLANKHLWRITFLGLREPTRVKMLEDKITGGITEVDLKIEKLGKGIAVNLGVVLPHVKPFLWPIIEDAQISFGLKEAIWQIVTSRASSILKISRLHALEMDKDLLDAILEYLFEEGFSEEEVSSEDESSRI